MSIDRKGAAEFWLVLGLGHTTQEAAYMVCTADDESIAEWAKHGTESFRNFSRIVKDDSGQLLDAYSSKPVKKVFSLFVISLLGICAICMLLIVTGILGALTLGMFQAMTGY